MCSSEKRDIGLSRTEITLFICQGVSILFFGLFTEYNTGTNPEAKVVDEATH